MARKPQSPRRKHVPQRTCIACRQAEGKRSLTRLVRTETGVEVDPTGKRAGRGAYLHPYRECWDLALRGNRLEQALRTKLSQDDRQRLAAFMHTLPSASQDAPGDGAAETGNSAPAA
jgi:hypothetical protein